MSEEKRPAMAGTNQPADQRTPEVIAAEIRIIKQKTVEYVENSTFEIGKRLAEAKASIGHGNWLPWLKSVGYGASTAEKIMNFYNRVMSGEQAMFGKVPNPQALENIGLTKADMLLTAFKDDEECADFMAQNNVDEMSTRELKLAIKERDEAKKELRYAEQERDRGFRERDAAKKELKQRDHTIHSLQAQFEASCDNADRLKKELEEKEAAGTDKDDSAMHELEVQLAVEKGKAKELEKKLEAMQNAPLEPAVIEKVPDDVQAELEKLRADAASANTQPVLDPEQQKLRAAFAAQFGILQQTFNALLEMTGKMEEADQAKYTMAMQKLAGGMLELLTGSDAE